MMFRPIWSKKQTVNHEPRTEEAGEHQPLTEEYDFMDSLPWYIVILREPRIVLNRIRQKLS